MRRVTCKRLLVFRDIQHNLGVSLLRASLDPLRDRKLVRSENPPRQKVSRGDREERSPSDSDGRTKQQTRSKAEEPEGRKQSDLSGKAAVRERREKIF